jgi:putative inorganic carbon (HCO3(-)) transporter
VDNGTAKTGALPEAPDLRREGALEVAQQVKRTGWLAGLRRAATWVAERELWLLAVVAPVLMFPEILPKAAVVAGLLLLSLLWLMRWVARGYVTVRTPLDMPILGLVAMLPISLYASVNFQLSFPKLTGIILGVATFYSIVNAVRTRRDIWLITGLLLLSGAGISVLGLVGTDWTAKFPLLAPIYGRLPRLISGVPRSIGGGLHPNEVGGALILFIPLALSLLLATVRVPAGQSRLAQNKGISAALKPVPAILGSLDKLVRSRWSINVGLSLILLITVFTLVLTQSRSAFFGLGVALVALGVIKNRWLRLIFGLAVAASIAILWYFGLERVGHLLLDVGEGTVAVGTLTFAGRLEVWQRAVYMIQDFPFTGIGLNTFDLVANAMYPFFLIGPEARVIHAHNNFLQIAVDLGIPGLVAYVGLLTVFTIIAWRVYRRCADPKLQALAVGLFCGMLAHQVYGLTDAITLGAKPGIVLWAFLGVVMALQAHSGLG